MRWCCISDAELRKCEEWALNIKSDPLVCVQATSVTKCIEMIKVGDSFCSGYKTAQGVYVLFELKRGISENEKEFMQGNLQPVEKSCCLDTQFMQILVLLFSLMLLAE